MEEEKTEKKKRGVIKGTIRGKYKPRQKQPNDLVKSPVQIQ
jgi:hypothetical protein